MVLEIAIDEDGFGNDKLKGGFFDSNLIPMVLLSCEGVDWPRLSVVLVSKFIPEEDGELLARPEFISCKSEEGGGTED